MGRTFQIYDQMRGYIENAGYVDVVARTWKVPIGGWAKDPRLKSVGLYTLLFLDQSVEGFALYMLKSVMGWEFEEIQVLIAQMKEAWKQWKRWQPYYEMWVLLSWGLGQAANGVQKTGICEEAGEVRADFQPLSSRAV